jgi:hypothetical protein
MGSTKYTQPFEKFDVFPHHGRWTTGSDRLSLREGAGFVIPHYMPKQARRSTVQELGEASAPIEFIHKRQQVRLSGRPDVQVHL